MKGKYLPSFSSEALDRAEIQKRVSGEIKHISASAGPQATLRAMYWVHRIHCLEAGKEGESRDKTILLGCVEAIRECYRDFEPAYDRKFFG